MTSENPSYERPADPFWRPLIRLIVMLFLGISWIGTIIFASIAGVVMLNLPMRLAGQLGDGDVVRFAFNMSIIALWAVVIGGFYWGITFAKSYFKYLRKVITEVRVGNAARAIRQNIRSAKRYNARGLKLNDKVADAEAAKVQHAAREKTANERTARLNDRYRVVKATTSP